ncbi:hypothetical protein KC992_01750 [Candidatus Saccharibacteria bacterium]|nr:hypothetical protein [Candidatus Saccharibacteria bacterium]
MSPYTNEGTQFGQPDHIYASVEELASAAEQFPRRFSPETHVLLTSSVVTEQVSDVQ